MKTKTTTSADLVKLETGYYGNFILPVDAATQIMALLVKSGAVKVEYEHVANTRIYYATQSDVQIKTLDGVYDPDIPVDAAARQPYLDWLKTKAEIVGKGYTPEPYAVFKETENA